MTTIKPIKIKPVEASEIKDIKIIHEAIAQVRKERTPEEWARIGARSAEGQEFLKRSMAK